MSQTPTSNDNIKTVAEAYGAIKAEMKALEKKAKELEPVLKEALADRGNVSVGKYVFTAKTMAGRKTMDKPKLESALRDNGLDIESFYKAGAPFVQMSVK
nr:hypothetical protein [Ilumatobacter sp.]